MAKEPFDKPSALEERKLNLVEHHLQDHLPAFQEIGERFIVDAAGDSESARLLTVAWRAKFGDKRATMILGMRGDCDTAGICAALLPIAGRILTVPIQNPDSATPQELCRAIALAAPRQESIAVRNLPAAIRIALSMERRTLITGSALLAREAILYLEAQRDANSL